MTSASVPPRTLVPASMRRPVTVALVVAAVVFALLAARYAGTSTPGRIDLHVDRLIDPLGAAHRWLVADTVVFGSPPVVVLVAVLMACVCLLLGRRRLAVLAIVGPGVTGVATTLLKPALGRTIGQGYAFPSGHTGGATALGLVAALLLVSLVRPGRVGGLTMLAVGASVAGGCVGAAMVAVDAHYPTDIIGGYCTAVVVVLGFALLLDRVSPRGRSGVRRGGADRPRA
ncbi:MAG: phosphatase PAP2 family protein [Pseudonocardia sp.]|uniref:phosphatase PAP2 family protein n=1 Tax=Pseudonocardia sp. TaxID=60912 RepID=UPI001AD351D3|nr:phosphatase PAP2 family protein [Pseudonocardia sp.]MBN9100031.1 phosphatase PAP2 family protein [Pseudonocardia sp.]